MTPEQAFLAVIVFCMAGVPDARLTNGDCQVIKYEPRDGITEAVCLADLARTADRIIAFRAAEGVPLRMFGHRCYPLDALRDVP